jgi:tetratricopeptide (TPR) repeat protein
MIETPTETKKRGRIARHWGKATAVAVALTAFLGWYVGIRDQGHLFLCDVAGLVGQKEVLPICRDEEAAPDETDPVALIEYLEAREDQLNPEQLEKLRRVKSRFADRTIEKLMEAVGLVGAPVDAEAEADTREAVRETVEEGDAEERRALAMIADGDLDGGLRLLSDLASASAVENAAQWRRIGRLAYAVDTAQALGAYEKVFALDQSDPWDAIYLGRLYERAGSLADARRTYADALGRLPEAKERDRAVLLNEIGDVLVAQGDLSGALESYRASLAIIERLAEADPNNAGWRRDLSVSHNNIGDVLVAQGDLSGALESYRASLAIAERLVETDPNNAGWRRDLSVSYERIGDLEDARGDIVAAIAAYEKSLPIAQSLADRFPDHPGFQSDIVITKRRLTELRAKFD